MPGNSIGYLLNTIRKAQKKEERPPEEDVVEVSETASIAASAYEMVRNTLEYDEEHLMRRNAIRRIIKRRMGQGTAMNLAAGIIRELVWARYLPNREVPESKIGEVAEVIKKYRLPFDRLRSHGAESQKYSDWLLDVLSTEIEYTIEPPRIDEAVASFAYDELSRRTHWESDMVDEEARDLQLYLAVHRTVLKSDTATLRFRLLTLYYPSWPAADNGEPVIDEIANNLDAVIESIEDQLQHKAGDAVERMVRKHTAVFHVLRDIIADNPDAFEQAVVGRQEDRLANAISKAAAERYDRFRTRLRRSVVRAVLFLFLTKTVMALSIELPYERFVLQETHWTPLLANIFFHPILLGAIGLTTSIPEKENTEAIVKEIKAILGWGDDFALKFKKKSTWSTGTIGVIFNLLYGGAFLFTVGVIIAILLAFDFNTLSIFFFLFFLSLVTFFGLKIRNTRRELLVVEKTGNIFGAFFDVLFIPVVRAGRWFAMRAPRVNVFLFFFDFIIEAPFKAAIRLVEGWLAFLREKKEEI